MDLQGLTRPFRGTDLEWRIQRAGLKNDKPWAIVVPYVDARAIMDRLDSVVGSGFWQTDLRPAGQMGKAHGMLGGIGILIDGIWVWKWDAAQATDIEPVKGGASGAIKRAAVQWGMGRDLYGVGDLFANIHGQGKHFSRSKVKVQGVEKEIEFHWDPPVLAEPAMNNVQSARGHDSTPTPVPASGSGLTVGQQADTLAREAEATGAPDRVARIAKAPFPRPAGAGIYAPTEKQVTFFKRLLCSHVFPDSEVEDALDWLASRATRATIKDRIDYLKTTLETRLTAEKEAPHAAR